MKYLSAIVSFLFIAVLILFATSNKEDTRVDFYPLPDAVFYGPLYLLVFVVVFLGFALGALVAWNTGRDHRRNARQAQKRVTLLEGELAAMRLRAEAAEERFSQASSVRADLPAPAPDAPAP